MMDISTNRDYRPLLKEALLEIEALQSELKAVQHTQTEPLAIIGMGCRFPGGGNNPEAFWQLLKNGSNLCVDIPASRWDIDAFYDPDPAAPGKIYTRMGHFLNVPIDRFDPQFFGLSPREARSLDPQQRLLLEVCWESLEHAGLDATGLLASKTGVFVGLMNVEYPRLAFPSYEAIDMHSASGNAPSTAAGRIAYTFGFQGPTLAIDTACSSSLVAVHMACQSLRLGECDMALACGTNLMLGPEMYIGECRSQMLSTDGLCKTFDIAADGFGRGEGCGVVVLKRLSDAQRDRDTILALIRGSAVNQDGRSGGLTVPNGLAQEQVIGAALNNGQVEPHQLQYVEAHGTGTSLGDPIEITALGNVFGQSHSQEQPLMVGSVKTNIGHTEATAGIAGLIKLVLQLQHDEIAPHLNLSTSNPYIDWEKAPVTIPTTLTPWPRRQTPRLAGVSSFGFSGTNAHVIVEEAPIAVPTQPDVSPESPWQILTLSAKEQTALQQLAKQYESYLETMPADDLADVCFSTRVGRAHFEKRLALVGQDKGDVLAQLRGWSSEEQSSTGTGKKGKTAVLFTGQGSQYVDMGRQLYETQPLFRQTLDHCNTILQAYLDLDILNILYPDTSETGQAQDQPLQSASPSPLDQTTYTQPALFVIEYALYKLWQSWGITPSMVMGHSSGAIVAACV
ncbi:MAG: type I polyketide synthase, partial [Leptolyngbya sp. SIO3F4]|nr:type I polyketide synthase [Leptolyngbya sp. SIO3F4]